MITAVQTGEALAKIVAAVKKVGALFASAAEQVRVSVAGQQVDLAAADDRGLGEVVRTLLGLPALTPDGVREALIIANSHYDDHGLAQLRSPGHDADALVRVLGDAAIGGFRVDLLADADERTIRRRVAAFFANRSRDQPFAAALLMPRRQGQPRPATPSLPATLTFQCSARRRSRRRHQRPHGRRASPAA